MPKILVDTIRYHHFPKEAKIPFAAGIVYLADRIVSVKPDIMEVNQDVLEYLQVSFTDTVNLREKILAKSNIFLKELSDF